jgi:hypothetical protein
VGRHPGRGRRWTEVWLWLATFGTEAATRMPDSRKLCGARRQPLERAGIHNQVEAEPFRDMLNADIDLLGEMSTPEQRQAMGEQPATDVREQMVWAETPEGNAAINADRRRQLAELEREWGPLAR